MSLITQINSLITRIGTEFKLVMKKASNLSDVGNRQTALNNLTDAANATAEHVLTKDTATGNSVFKAAKTALSQFTNDLKLLNSSGNYVWSAETNPGSLEAGLSLSFVSANEGFPSYGTVISAKSYAGGGSALQMYIPYSPTYGGDAIRVRFGNYDGGDVWTPWHSLIDSNNIAQQAVAAAAKATAILCAADYIGDDAAYKIPWMDHANGAADDAARLYQSPGFYYRPASGILGAPVIHENGSRVYSPNTHIIGFSIGGNSVVQRDPNGHIYANYINFNQSEAENPTISSFLVSNGDGWARKASLAHVKSQLGMGSLDDNAVTYAKQGAEFKGDLTIASNAIDWATGVYAEITLTANQTYTFTNLEKGKTIVIRMTGAFVPTLPSSCELVNGGTYTGAKYNYLVMTCVNSTTPKVLLSINTTA